MTTATANSRTQRDVLPAGYELLWHRIESVLGQGSFGITYLARDTNLGQHVAIKEYLPTEFAVREEDSTVQPRTGQQGDVYRWGLERFMTEARTLAQFKHHNIVRVLSVFEHNNTAYMVMEYEDGQDLAKLFARRSRIDEEEMKRWVLPVADGLRLVHEADFIHRDIKPANIFVRADGSPVLLDFGSARQALSGRTQSMTKLVTVGYAPFEQYSDTFARQGPWTDIYALAASLYRGIAGKVPADALSRSAELLRGRPDPLEPIETLAPQGYSPAFLRAIDLGLRFRPQERPQSLGEWTAMLIGGTALWSPPEPAEHFKTLKLPTPVASGRTVPFARNDRGAPAATTGAPTAVPARTEPYERPAAAANDALDGAGETVRYQAPATGTERFAHPRAPAPTEPYPQPRSVAPTQPATDTIVDTARPTEPPTAREAQPVHPRASTKRPALTGALVTALVAALAVAGYLWLSAGEPPIEALPRPEQPLSVRHPAELVDALAAALDESLTVYRDVARLSPDDPQATAGLTALADDYRDLAHTSWRQGNPTRALALAEQGLAAAPSHPALRQLQAQLQAAQSGEAPGPQDRARVDALLSAAQAHARAARFIAPRGENAVEAYQAVLTLDPDNADARRHLDEMAGVFERAARESLRQRQFAAAVAAIEQGLLIAPGHARLRQLRRHLAGSPPPPTR